MPVCPNCRTPMIVVEHEGVELDYCIVCRGTWFDAGELEFVSELAGAPPGRMQAALQATGSAKSDRRCPRCRRKMQIISIGGAAPVHVDRCPHGDGLWLDAGELAAVVRHLGGSQDAAVADFFGDLFRHNLSGQVEE